MLFLPQGSGERFVGGGEAVEASMGFVLVFILLVLSFDVDKGTLGVARYSRGSIGSYRISTSSLSTGCSCHCNDSVVNFSGSRALSISSIRLNFGPISRACSSGGLHLHEVLRSSSLFGSAVHG